MTTPLENALPKGSFAIAHTQSSGYSLIAGAFHYSRYRVVKVTKATREGRVKEYIDGPGCAKRVERKTTIYAFPSQYAHKAEAMLALQDVGFVGYHDKAELKAALEACAELAVA